MSFLDKITAAVMPAASDEDRSKARAHAQSLTTGGDWLGHVLDHHRQIEDAFRKTFAAFGADDRKAAMKELGTLLVGHSIAEEVALYPAVAEHSGKSHAAMAFEEQSMAKVEMAQLEKLDPTSRQWHEKLLHIQSAVQQHMYEEEHSYFPDIVESAPQSEQGMLTARYMEEFTRYCGADHHSMHERDETASGKYPQPPQSEQPLPLS